MRIFNGKSNGRGRGQNRRQIAQLRGESQRKREEQVAEKITQRITRSSLSNSCRGTGREQIQTRDVAARPPNNNQPNDQARPVNVPQVPLMPGAGAAGPPQLNNHFNAGAGAMNVLQDPPLPGAGAGGPPQLINHLNAGAGAMNVPQNPPLPGAGAAGPPQPINHLNGGASGVNVHQVPLLPGVGSGGDLEPINQQNLKIVVDQQTGQNPGHRSTALSLPDRAEQIRAQILNSAAQNDGIPVITRNMLKVVRRFNQNINRANKVASHLLESTNISKKRLQDNQSPSRSMIDRPSDSKGAYNFKRRINANSNPKVVTKKDFRRAPSRVYHESSQQLVTARGSLSLYPQSGLSPFSYPPQYPPPSVYPPSVYQAPVYPPPMYPNQPAPYPPLPPICHPQSQVYQPQQPIYSAPPYPTTRHAHQSPYPLPGGPPYPWI